jgi:hypothetical protein
MDLTTTAQQPIALVDVEDLADGDLAARLADIDMPAAVVSAPSGYLSAADMQIGVDAVISAWTVVADCRAAVDAHLLGARAAALVA